MHLRTAMLLPICPLASQPLPACLASEAAATIAVNKSTQTGLHLIYGCDFLYSQVNISSGQIQKRDSYGFLENFEFSRQNGVIHSQLKYPQPVIDYINFE